MRIASFVYRQYLQSGGLARRFWSLPRKILIHLLGDPTCSMQVHGRLLSMRLSHSLPIYFQDHPCYDRLPQRIAQFIKRKSGHVRLIDVGANIGDTIAAFYTGPEDQFLAIEPDPNFRKFLIANWGANPNVRVISDLCSSESLEGTYRLEEKNGTASLIPSTDGLALRSRSLDDILKDDGFAKPANILKVDTDGHDFKVLAGAKGFISENRPVVLFECAPFGNAMFIEQATETLERFHQAGYGCCLLYSNLGDFMGKYDLKELSAIKNLFFYQLLTDALYYDVLLINDQDVGEFFQSEAQFFADRVADRNLRPSALKAISG